MKNYLILGIVVLVVAVEAAWLLRWELTPVNEQPFAYQLDRWTGSVYLVWGGRKMLTREQ